MTAKCAMCIALLEGRILNVSNCFKDIGITNIAREIPRMIETPFNLTISRVARIGKSRYGQLVQYTDYRLNKDAEYNQVGIALLKEYIKGHGPKSVSKSSLYQPQLF